MIALVTGGSGCGKSYYAERLAKRMASDGMLYYIATMDAYDDECKTRVLRHRSQREGLGFMTLEQPLGIDKLILEPDSTALLECLPTLMSNEMFLRHGKPDVVFSGIEKLAQQTRNLIVVTNDVFSDGIAYDASVEQYRECLAKITADVAAMSDVVVEVVYTVPVLIKGVLP